MKDNKINFMKQDRLEIDIYDIEDFNSYDPMDLDGKVPISKCRKITKLSGSSLKMDEMESEKIGDNIYSINYKYSIYKSEKKISTKFDNIVLKSEKEITKKMILDVVYKRMFPKL
ncbi:MAG: hypothetical protein B6I28_00420 [Fusobacteriia bacterium 4572_132]|nr:MAG: hypothetical protein B6I28_00420 [Fusobacteriia bacterium 4572_132]